MAVRTATATRRKHLPSTVSAPTISRWAAPPVGVPTDTGGLSAGLAGVGDIAATASKMAEDVTRGLTEQKEGEEGEEGFLGVEVIGFGEDEQGDEVLNLRKRKRSNNQ